MDILKFNIFNILPDKKYNINIKFPTQYIGFELKNANTSFANAIRRVCEGELLIKRLTIDTIETNDVFMIQEYFNILLKTIPISQDIPNNEKFYIDIKSDLPEDIIITSKDIKKINNYINDNMPIVKLCGKIKNAPRLDKYKNESISLKATLKVVEDYGYLDGAFNQCESGGSVIQSIDVPPNAFGGLSSTETYPTSFYIKMISRGGMNPGVLLTNAISNLISRLRNLQDITINVNQNIEGIYKIALEDTITIGELIFMEVHALDENNDSFMYDWRERPGFIIFRSRNADLKKIIDSAADSVIKKLNLLMDKFKKIPEPINCYGHKEFTDNLLKKYNHLPLIGDSKEVAVEKTKNKNVNGGWIYLLNRKL